jgi:chromosome segregation ATPase
MNLELKLQNIEEKNSQLIEELSFKEEQLVVSKIEIQTSENKLKTKSDECIKFENECMSLRQKFTLVQDEKKQLEMGLSKARENSERLHRESETVITNVNSWVSEQRNNSDKLANKIREQASAIIQINNEKEKLMQDNEFYAQQIKKLQQEIENAMFDREKLKTLQNHFNQQQSLLHQLQSRLKEYEYV